MKKVTSMFESGYLLGSDWRSFIDCWQHKSVKRPGGKWAAWKSAETSKEEMEGELRSLETRLKSRLPPSYREFLIATNGNVERAAPRRRQDEPLFRSAREVDWLRRTSPEVVAIWSRNPERIADSEYLKYDLEQYMVGFRPQYVKHVLHIGNREESNVILLNPMVVTKDGEWEAWFLSPHIPGTIRYPSFAHLIRDLSLADTGGGKGEEGPYPEARHTGSCSELMPVRSVYSATR